MPTGQVEHKDAERQTLDEIYDWYEGMVASLTVHRGAVLEALALGSQMDPRFQSFDRADVEAYFESQRVELDRLTNVNLVGSAEASIRLDVGRRTTGNLVGPLSQSYQAWYKTLSSDKQDFPNFDGKGILERLGDSKTLPDNNVLGRFRECLKPRHWIAHGRYFAKHANVEKLTPDVVRDRAKALLAAVSATA